MRALAELQGRGAERGRPERVAEVEVDPVAAGAQASGEGERGCSTAGGQSHGGRVLGWSRERDRQPGRRGPWRERAKAFARGDAWSR